jgi:hypothetical protein
MKKIVLQMQVEEVVRMVVVIPVLVVIRTLVVIQMMEEVKMQAMVVLNQILEREVRIQMLRV